MPIAIGPCVVTADEVDPQVMYLQVRIDGDEVAKGNLNGTASNLARSIEAASRLGTLERGDALALNPVPALDWQLWPGATVDLGAEGIGTLTNTVAAG